MLTNITLEENGGPTLGGVVAICHRHTVDSHISTLSDVQVLCLLGICCLHATANLSEHCFGNAVGLELRGH